MRGRVEITGPPAADAFHVEFEPTLSLSRTSVAKRMPARALFEAAFKAIDTCDVFANDRAPEKPGGGDIGGAGADQRGGEARTRSDAREVEHAAVV